MSQAKSHAADFAINVVAGLTVAAVSWLAATLGSDPTKHVPLWVTAGSATLIGLVVVSGAAYINFTRREQRLHRVENELAAAHRKILEMRELDRVVAQLIKEEPARLTRELAYTVDPDGYDRIESVWQLHFGQSHQGRVFITEDWSTYPTPEEVTCVCDSEDHSSSTVLPVVVIDEPTRKSSALYLDPPVGTTPRRLRLRQTWPGLWKDLREKGADYVELTARPGLQRAETKIHIPEVVGRFRWKQNTNKGVTLGAVESGAQQTLTMLIEHPEAGQTYRADLERIR